MQEEGRVTSAQVLSAVWRHGFGDQQSYSAVAAILAIGKLRARTSVVADPVIACETLFGAPDWLRCFAVGAQRVAHRSYVHPGLLGGGAEDGVDGGRGGGVGWGPWGGYGGGFDGLASDDNDAGGGYAVPRALMQGPQSAQSWPQVQSENSLPMPPSSQSPSLL